MQGVWYFIPLAGVLAQVLIIHNLPQASTHGGELQYIKASLHESEDHLQDLYAHKALVLDRCHRPVWCYSRRWVARVLVFFSSKSLTSRLQRLVSMLASTHSSSAQLPIMSGCRSSLLSGLSLLCYVM